MYSKVLLISESLEQSKKINKALKNKGFDFEFRLVSDSNIKQQLVSNKFNIAIFSVYKTQPNQITLLHHIQKNAPKPVIVFTEKSDEQWILDAVNAGANSIVVDGIEEHRIINIVNIAIARFERCMLLHSELTNTKQKLQERKDIERVKGILMHKNKISEDAAYQLIRKMAMDKKLRIGEVANSLLYALELLD
ncbi:MAG: ANTAR domain-containing protein [Pseudomonadota bacterium]